MNAKCCLFNFLFSFARWPKQKIYDTIRYDNDVDWKLTAVDQSGMCSRTPWSRAVRQGQGQGSLRSRPRSDHFGSKPRMRLWNPTWLVRLHRSYVVEEKRLLKVGYSTDTTGYCSQRPYTIMVSSISSKFNVLRPDLLEAKAKAAHRRGQGQGHKILSSRCPRGRGQFSRTPSLELMHFVHLNQHRPIFGKVLLVWLLSFKWPITVSRVDVSVCLSVCRQLWCNFDASISETKRFRVLCAIVIDPVGKCLRRVDWWRR